MKIEVTPTCWLWTGTKSASGYGLIQVGRKVVKAHRASYETHTGPIPVGLLVCHACDIRHCINPEHLFLGTDAANAIDKVQKNRQAHGAATAHPGAANGSAKVTEEQVAEIRQRHARGESRRALQVSFGLGRSALAGIVNNTSWVLPPKPELAGHPTSTARAKEEPKP